jgi:hypothetical protein
LADDIRFCESAVREFEARLEARRQAGAQEEEEWKALRRGWCLGSEHFKKHKLKFPKIDFGQLSKSADRSCASPAAYARKH